MRRRASLGISVVPKLRRRGGRTGGPLRSVQFILNGLSTHQAMLTWPPPVASAPYLLALVASSWRAMPMASGAAPFIRSFFYN
jgi:hypothetical protein